MTKRGETIRELNAKILAITMQIQEMYSELSKFLNESPVSIPNESKPKINIKILEDYYETLENILKHITTVLPPIRVLTQSDHLTFQCLNLSLKQFGQSVIPHMPLTNLFLCCNHLRYVCLQI
jgi:hypothetical protein